MNVMPIKKFNTDFFLVLKVTPRIQKEKKTEKTQRKEKERNNDANEMVDDIKG